MKFVLCASILAIGAAATGHAATTVYANDFSGGLTTGFSAGAIQTSPNGSAQFLGQFTQGGSTTLTLDGLASHGSVTVSFDVDAILSMDGDGQFGGGRDQFLVTRMGSGTSTLLDNDYANFPGNSQDNGGQGTPTVPGGYAARAGALSFNTFGYAYGGDTSIDDSVYHYSFTFDDSASTLAIRFAGNATEGVDNEFYGIDNVVVSTDAAPAAVPEPASWALMVGGFGMIGGAMRGRRRPTIGFAMRGSSDSL